MTTDAYASIIQALEKTSPGLSEKVSMDTHLVNDGIVDSLDSMSFLFELEQILGKKLNEIDETFDDFRVSRLVEIIHNA